MTMETASSRRAACMRRHASMPPKSGMPVLPPVNERRTSIINWAIVVLAVAGALAINRQRAVLVDPAACPGLLEWLTAVASSLSGAPIAAVIAVLNGAGVVVGLLVFGRLREWIPGMDSRERFPESIPGVVL